MSETGLDDPDPKQRQRELADLVRLAQGGQTEAFEQIVKRTEGYARQLAYPVVGPNSCEDVLQESYLLAYRKLGQVKKPEAFMSWLCRLVLHVAYRFKKKNPRMEEIPEEVSGAEETEAVVDSLVLEKALGELKNKERNLLILRELLQLSYDEISRVFQVPVGTVRSRLHKARRRLAERLQS